MTTVILLRRKLGAGSARRMAAASQEGLVPVRNWVPSDMPDDASLVIRWGCTSNAPVRNVLNTARSIHWCSNKRQGRLDMQAAGVPVPETWTAEYVFGPESPFAPGMDGMFVLRPATHAQGKKLWTGTDFDIVRHIRENDVYGGYVSRLIDKVAEFRVCVAQNRVVWVAKKTPGNPDEVAWNVARGGRFDNVRWGDWPPQVLYAGLKAARVSGTDFCGVDVMVDAEGNPFVLEVNSAPSMTSDYRAGCLAKVFDFITCNGKEHFPDPSSYGWKSTIHPAIRS